jgi:hypothetical protein
MGHFNSYVKLPEGIGKNIPKKRLKLRSVYDSICVYGWTN